MKKQIMIALTIAFASLIYGCSFAQVEKEPQVIEETQEDSSKNRSVEDAESSDAKLDIKGATLIEADEADDASQNDTANKENADQTDAPATITDLPPASDEPFFYTIELEGMKEDIKVKTHDSDLGYSMLYDVDRFTVAKEHGADLYFTENPNPDIYPFVYINVIRVDDISLNDYIAQRKDALTQHISNVEQFDKVTLGKYEAVRLKAVAGSNWDSIIRNMYFLQDGDSILEIETQYFLEAEEGYGARISALLDTFTLQ